VSTCTVWIDWGEPVARRSTIRGGHVYLSGGMEYVAGEGRDWRSEMQGWLERELGCSVFNPNRESERFLRERLPGVDFRQLKRDNPERFQQVVSAIVDRDSAEIAEQADVVVCLWDDGAHRGAGTTGELTIARRFGKPVYMVTQTPREELPGWILGCVSRMFDSFTELKAYLLER